MKNKHKVGDTVTIKSAKWFEENSRCGVVENELLDFTYSMTKYCGMKAKILEYDKTYKYYLLSIDEGIYGWCDYMFED